MRRLIAAAVVAVLAAPASAQALQLREPDGYVLAHPHASSVAAQLELRGRTRPNSLVPLYVRCELGPCEEVATADERGRFEGLLNVVLPREQTKVRVRVGEEWFRFPLDLPEYAAFTPYADDARVPELVMVGDSLAVGTDAALRASLPGWRVTTDAREGRPAWEGLDVLRMTPLPRRPRALAFSLFTNDDPRETGMLDTVIDYTLDRLRRRDCAIWATIVRPRVGGVSYRAANDVIRAYRSDPRVRVVDWAKAVARNPEWLRDDKVHPTPEGYAARARMYARAALDCPVASPR